MIKPQEWQVPSLWTGMWKSCDLNPSIARTLKPTRATEASQTGVQPLSQPLSSPPAHCHADSPERTVWREGALGVHCLATARSGWCWGDSGPLWQVGSWDCKKQKLAIKEVLKLGFPPESLSLRDSSSTCWLIYQVPGHRQEEGAVWDSAGEGWAWGGREGERMFTKRTLCNECYRE